MIVRRKVIFFIPSLYAGGAEKVLVDLANLLDQEKYEVTVLTLLGGGEYEKRLRAHVTYQTVIRSKSGLIKRILDSVISNIIPYGLFHRVYIGKKYDVEVAYLEGYVTHVIANSCSKRSYKVALVHTSFRTNFDIGRNYRKKEACLREYERFDRVGFVSDALMRDFEESAGKLAAAEVICNVYDPFTIVKKSTESIFKHYRPDTLKLLAAGRLEKEKGNKRLIDTVLSLRREGFDVELWLIGDGSEFDDLMTIAKRNCDTVKLLGYQKNPYPYMKAADLLVCPSFTEGYSTVAAEASFLALPVLTTDCPGMEEILAGGNGMIVENSSQGLYIGLKSILEDPSRLLTMKRNAIKYSEVFFEKTQNNLKGYERLLDGE